MSKIAIIGDTHFCQKIPVSRKDNYPITLLDKVKNLLELCKTENISDCIFLGDLIEAARIDIPYLIEVYKLFTEFKKENIKLHLIIGNHDYLYNKDNIAKSPLMLFLASGLFSNEDFKIDDCYFKLVNYYTNVSEIEKVTDKNLYNILIGHYFYINGFNDAKHTISIEDANRLEYNCYFLGHDHTPYKPVVTTKYEVHRPGSFSRSSSQSEQVNRDAIQVCIFDTEKHNIIYKDIPNVLPSKDIYKESKLIEKLNSYKTNSISEDIENLINDMSFSFNSDIYEILDKLEIEPEIKVLTEEYLYGEGLFRKKS